MYRELKKRMSDKGILISNETIFQVYRFYHRKIANFAVEIKVRRRALF